MTEKSETEELLRDLPGKSKSSFPVNVEPMLATLADGPSGRGDWLYEIKWDGFRSIAYMDGEKAEIRSRNNKDFSARFYPVQWGVRAVVDGETVVLNNKGYPDFSALQTWRSEADGELVYFLFDILWVDGYDLRKVPLVQRRAVLKQIAPAAGAIRYFYGLYRDESLQQSDAIAPPPGLVHH